MFVDTKSVKFFSKKTLTKHQLRTVICAFASSMNVKKVTFSKRAKYVAGTYNCINRVIFIDMKQNRKNILLTFFHELAHHISCSKGKWLEYHNNATTPLISASAKFDIENKIDKLAKKLWYKHVDIKQWGKYKYGYPKSQSKRITRWLVDNY